MRPESGCRGHGEARIGRDPALTLRVLDQRGPNPARGVVEAFIGERFASRHGARVRHFMPTLLTLEDGRGALHAAVGVRGGAAGTLFVERYFDAPIETEIARRCGITATRARIVEVGNLAARGSGQFRLLIVALTDLLVAHGFEWVVFTGTAEVLNSFHRLQLAPLTLGEADPARIGDEFGHWGNYYDARPQVMVGNIRAGHEQLATRGVFERFAYQGPCAHSGGDDAAVA